MFANKVVLITGGSSGIGAAAAESFAKERASICIVGRNGDRLYEVAERCKTLGGNVLTIKADVSKDEEVDKIVNITVEKFGKLDVLVNNAGIMKGASIKDTNFLDIFDETMNVNLRGPTRITRQAVPYLIKTKGNIINISSVAGSTITRPNYTAYRTSKAALNHFTRCCAFELAEHGVRVNSISPGPVKTNLFGDEASAEAMKKFTALHRISDSNEVAELILYMASDKAKGVTGSNYVLDNGVLLK